MHFIFILKLMSRKFFILFYLCSINLFSQTNLDTLLQKLKTSQHDTDLYNSYYNLGNYFQKSNPEKAFYYHSQAEKTADKIPGARGILDKAEAIRSKGWDYYIISNYDQAINLYEKALNITEKYLDDPDKTIKTKAKKLWANIIGNIGVVFHEQGNFAKALEYYFKALKINEEIGNKQSKAANFGNIGIVYDDLGDYSKALEYYFDALKIYNEIGHKLGIVANLGNIGIVYDVQSNYVKALEYYFKALYISEKIGYKQGQSAILGNIGSTYEKQGRYSKALEYYFRALKINKEIGNKRSQAINLGNIGSTYLKLKQISTAEKYLKNAEQLNKELGTIHHLKYAYASLSGLFEQTGKYKEALHYFKEYSDVYDTLNFERNRKALQTMEVKYQY